jgi:hypothetical protein
MFWNCKKPVMPENEGKSKADLENELAEAKKQIEYCTKVIEEMNSEIAACTPMIDFDTMRVFSIERVVSNNRGSTIIGYYIQEPVLSSDGEMVVLKDVVKEWTLYCNTERHEELVKKYIAWKAKK